MGISLNIIVDSVYSCGALLIVNRNPSTDFSRILTIMLGLIFTGKVSLVVILQKKNVLLETGSLKLSIFCFDPVILSDASGETEMSWAFCKAEQEFFFSLFFSSYRKLRVRFWMLIIRGLKKGKIPTL